MTHQVILLDFLNINTPLYLASKQAQNLSQSTITKYTSVLEKFYDFCCEKYETNKLFNLIDLNEHFMNNYVIHLRQEKLSPVSQKNNVTIIKNYLGFIAKHNPINIYLKTNLVDYSIKVSSKEKPYLSQQEQNRINIYIALLDNKHNYLAHRNSLILKLLLNTGIRISELTNIKWTDLTLSNDCEHGNVYTILINGKGNKQRYTYVQSELIAKNIQVIQKKARPNYIFSTPKGTPSSRSHIFYTIKNILTKAGVAKSGLHIFRHTFARNLVNQNQNLSTIKELLGHSNISTTAQFYAKADEHAKKNALFKNH
jgi:site-specific recombinase XerD